MDPEYEDFYDNGPGSENMKRQIAKSARENPVPNLYCKSCTALREENERLRKQLELGHENFKVWYDMNNKKRSLCMGETERRQYFEILQALKG